MDLFQQWKKDSLLVKAIYIIDLTIVAIIFLMRVIIVIKEAFAAEYIIAGMYLLTLILLGFFITWLVQHKYENYRWIIFIGLMSFFSSLKGYLNTKDTTIIFGDLIPQLFLVLSLTYIDSIHQGFTKSRFWTTLKNLNKHEVIFWGPGLFVVSTLSMIAVIIGFFLPWGFKDNMSISIIQLFLVSPSVQFVLLLLVMPLIAYSIAKKSFLKVIILQDAMTILLLLTTDFYQHIVGKPYAIAVNIYAVVAVTGIIMLIVGMGVIFGAWREEDFFKYSQY